MNQDPTAIPIDLDPQQQRMSGIAYHGDTPFDVPFVSQITDNLYTGGCAMGLILPRNIKHLFSLYPWERYQVDHQLKTEVYVRLYDATDGVEADLIAALVPMVASCIQDGPTLVHCQAGLNRSSMIAALALIHNGMEPQEAVDLLREKRSDAVLCNRSFEAHVLGVSHV